MKTIHISDLEVPGSTLFSDEESYLNEINKDELKLTHGEGVVAVSLAIVGSAAGSIAVGSLVREIHDYDEGVLANL